MVMNYESQNVLTPGTHPPFKREKAINFFFFILRYSMYNDHILYLINEWSAILDHDNILKVLSDKNTPPKKFSKF